ncbi:MAG: hypothetical protein LBJ10_02665 [Clostridiales bacterium]|jgi:hypothetical protein|nr:hypothetical protein [Clostridiales bacterium]
MLAYTEAAAMTLSQLRDANEAFDELLDLRERAAAKAAASAKARAAASRPASQAARAGRWRRR